LNDLKQKPLDPKARDKKNYQNHTIEALIDELEHCVVRVKAADGSNSRIYLQCAVKLISDWSRVGNRYGTHQFVFNLSDIKSDALNAELIDLGNSTHSTLIRVLHAVLNRLFDQVSASWFYLSAADDIEVLLKP
jgi:hypothetical protein